MAQIIDDTPYERERDQGGQIPYITEDIANSASQANDAAKEFFDQTKEHSNVPYVKALHDAVNSTLSAVYPVQEGAPTGPYIDGLLKKRKELEQVEESVRSGRISVDPKDEDAGSLAINLYQRFSMTFMFVLMQFEEGLSPEQRW